MRISCFIFQPYRRVLLRGKWNQAVWKTCKGGFYDLPIIIRWKYLGRREDTSSWQQTSSLYVFS